MNNQEIFIVFIFAVTIVNAATTLYTFNAVFEAIKMFAGEIQKVETALEEIKEDR